MLEKAELGCFILKPLRWWGRSVAYVAVYSTYAREGRVRSFYIETPEMVGAQNAELGCLYRHP